MNPTLSRLLPAAPRARVALAAILALSLLLRASGVGFGVAADGKWVGTGWHPDEMGWVVDSLVPDLDHRYYYGSLHIYSLFAINVAYYGVVKALSIEGGRDYRSFVESTQVERYVLFRLVSSLYGTLTVWLMFLLGRRLIGEGGGLLAAFLGAVNPFLVLHAHYCTADAALVFWMLLGVWSALSVYERGERRDYLFAGFVVAAALSVKYNGGAIVAPIALAHFLRPGRSPLAALREPGPWAAAAVLLGAFLLMNPFLLIHAGSSEEKFASNLGHLGAFTFEGEWWRGYLNYPRELAVWTGKLLTVLGVGGLFLWFRKDWKTAAILVSMPVLYYLVISSFAVGVPRYMLPLAPLVLLWAARLLVDLGALLARRLPVPRLPQAATAALVAVALWTPTAQLLANERMLWREDTRYAAARWIVENIPEGARIVVEDPGGYGPVVDPKRYEIGLHNFRPEDDVTSLAEAYEKGYEYFVASALMYQLNPQLDTENLYRDLEADPRVVPVMVFPGMSLEDNFHHPEIKIYRLYDEAPERIAPITAFFPQDGRYGWLFHLDGPWQPDSEEAPTRSLLMLYEDDHPLGPPHSKHDDIRERGGGRYSHWEEWILFSTSDNTDPNRNGRKYWVRSLE